MPTQPGPGFPLPSAPTQAGAVVLAGPESGAAGPARSYARGFQRIPAVRVSPSAPDGPAIPDLLQAARDHDSDAIRTLGAAHAPTRGQWLLALRGALHPPIDAGPALARAHEAWELLVQKSEISTRMALRQALEARNEFAVAWLLGQGADPNQPLPGFDGEDDPADEGYHPLGVVWDWLAVGQMTALVSRGTDKAPPMVRIAILLLAAGADPNIPLNPAPKDGFRSWVSAASPEAWSILSHAALARRLPHGTSDPRFRIRM